MTRQKYAAQARGFDLPGIDQVETLPNVISLESSLPLPKQPSRLRRESAQQ